MVGEICAREAGGVDGGCPDEVCLGGDCCGDCLSGGLGSLLDADRVSEGQTTYSASFSDGGRACHCSHTIGVYCGSGNEWTRKLDKK